MTFHAVDLVEVAILLLWSFLIGATIGSILRLTLGRGRRTVENAAATAVADAPSLLAKAPADAPGILPAAPMPIPVVAVVPREPGSLPAPLATAPLATSELLAAIAAMPLLLPPPRVEKALPVHADPEPVAGSGPVGGVDVPAQALLAHDAGSPLPPIIYARVPLEPSPVLAAEVIPFPPLMHPSPPNVGTAAMWLADLQGKPPAEVPSASPQHVEVAAAATQNPTPVDENAAMRAIEGGWTPRGSAVRQDPADVPELSAEDAIAASRKAIRAAGAATMALLDLAADVSADPGAQLASDRVVSDAAPIKKVRSAGR